VVVRVLHEQGDPVRVGAVPAAASAAASPRRAEGDDENHGCAFAIWAVHCNFVRTHRTLRMLPALKAGVTDHRWSLDDVVALLDEAADRPS
jgi:hypothetical protein